MRTMRTLLATILLSLPTLVMEAITIGLVRADETPAGMRMNVIPERVAYPITQDAPVVIPYITQTKSGGVSNQTPPTSTSSQFALATQSVGAQSVGCAPASSQPAPLVALASALKCDADLIFEYVYNNIEFEPLYRSNKGALGTLLDRRGNDADQAILFVTLLNIAGYSQTGYANVLLGMTGAQIANWLGVANDATAIGALLSGGGIPFTNAVVNPDGSLASIQVLHFLAALRINGTWYYFDPSFKFHNIVAGVSSLASALGYDKTQFLAHAGGTIDSISISNINRVNLRADLVQYSTNLINYINQHDRTWSVSNLIGGKSIQPLTGSPIRWQIPSVTPTSAFPANCPFQSPVVECRTSVTVAMPGAVVGQAIKLYTDQIYGHRITVFSTPSGANFVPTLLVDGVAPSCVASGTCTNVGPATAPGPNQTWSISTQITQTNQGSNAGCASGVTGCGTLKIAVGGSFLINIGVGKVGRGMAEYHRQLLAQARAAGNSDSSELVLGESLASIGFGFLAQFSAQQDIVEQLIRVSAQYYFDIGIVGQSQIQQSGFQGPYIDLPLSHGGTFPWNSGGPTTTIGPNTYQTSVVSSGFSKALPGSSFESAILEQTQAPVPGMTAASTIKLIDTNMDPSYPGALGRTFFADGTTPAGQATYTNTIVPLIQANYNATDLSKISAAVAGGSQVLIPQNGLLAVGHWTGSGFLGVLPEPSSITFALSITGGMSGGFTGANDPNPAPNSQTTLPPAANSDTANPLINTTPSPFNPQIADPVDGITGAYVYKHDDLVTGSGKFPYALDFSRTYLSSSGSSLTTTAADTGIGNGWAHNWSSNVTIQSDPYLGIGKASSPATNAATSIVALFIIQDLMSATPTAQTLTISSMVARWFTDQLTANAAMVTLPNTTEEFIALPHADSSSSSISYNAPPGSSARLAQTAPGQFSYTLKDGVVLNFGSTPAGALQSMVYPNGVTISLNYSGSPLRLSRIASNLGRSLDLAYNAGRVAAVTDDSGRSVTYTYDSSHNLTGFTDPLGATTTFAYDTSGTYDTLGHLTQIFYPSFPANAFVSNWYDPLGRVVRQANAIGGISQYYFAGSRTEQVDPFGNRQVTYQTDRGRILKDALVLSNASGNVFGDTIQQNGLINVTTNRYDGLDRLKATFFPERGAVSYEYATNVNPWANNVSFYSQFPKPGFSGGTITTFEYDVNYNQVTKTTDSLGLIGALGYEPSTGNLTSAISDAGGAGHFNATSRFTYNSSGQPVTATDPLGTVTRFSYDSFGNQSSIVRDAGAGRLNQLTTLTYNARGDVVSITDPKGNTTTNTYDAARRLITTTAPNDLITTYNYDPDGHVINVKQTSYGSVLRNTSTTYTPTGKPATVTDANGNITTFSYDLLDRVSTVKDAMGRTTSYGYDALSRQISISNLAIQSTPLLQKSYTPDGLLASVTDANSRTTSFAYDGLDRLATTTYPLGSTETLTYDADNNVLTRKTRANQTISFAYDTLNRLKTKTPPSPAPVVSYSYDLAGRLTGISDTSAAIAAAVPPSGTSVQYSTSLGYDAMNRPTAVTWSPAPSAAAAPAAGSVTFGHSYNKVNQRIGQTVTDNSWFNYPAASPSTVSYTANALNQYTAVGAVTPSYDGNGNLTSDGTFTFGYDTENRLTSASGAGNTASYTFDAQGRRKTKTVNGMTTAFVTDAANREVLEYDGASGAILRWYAYGLGPNDVLGQMNVAADTRATLVPDMLGSVIGSLDSGSGVLSKVGYLPYGKGTSAGPFGFTGQRIDPETSGLYYYRARHYSPAWGRFLQPDPIGYRGGNHLYAYVNNNPLNATDPLGLDCVSSGGATSCTTSAYSVNFPTPKGWQDFTSSSTNYHFYSTPANAGSANPAAVQQWVVNNPTPGTTNPATPQGALNDATPFVGSVSPINISPVQSFTTTNQANGSPVVVNVTLPGHQLFPGVVVRQVDQTSNGTVINNYGEGTSTWQSPNTFLGKEFGSNINGVWAGQVPPLK
jgi:RHS repeat-associated protein